jgi:hypothetical protein
VPASAELGYHASIVSMDCDEGAAEALKPTGGAAPADLRYAAVYVGGEAEAKRFAGAFTDRPVHVVKVRTWCVP